MTKSTKCSVCTLPSVKLAAIDQSLRDGASLQAISYRTGVSKSSLWRHSRHIAEAADSDPPPTRAVVARNEHRRPQAPAQSAAVVPPAQVPRRRSSIVKPHWQRLWIAPNCFSAKRWLEGSKRPITLTKPDGSEIELPGDLRSRTGFIRAARDVLDQLARLRGLYDPQTAPRFGEVVFENVIMMPKLPGVCRPAGKVVDARPEPAGSLTDGGTPDREGS